MIWIIIPFIAFYVMYWFFTKPCLKEERIPDPNCSYRSMSVYKPYGLKIWKLILIILTSIIPLVNIIAIVIVIGMFFVIIDGEMLDWDEVFPKDENYKPNKFIQFLNKEIGKKK